jgi:chemotaxis signal transduction protein
VSALHDLRTEFDNAFARANVSQAAACQQYLGIQVGTSGYAVRVLDIGGLFADRPITRLPNADATFLGIAGLRGAVIPVYDLASLLGHPRSNTPRWLILVRGALALAFDAFDTHLNLPATAVVPARQPRPGGFVREALQADGAMRAIVDVNTVFNSIEQRTVHRDVRKES